MTRAFRRPRQVSAPLVSRWVPVVMVLAALAVRSWHLDHMSIWQDEGLSLYRATRGLAELMSGHIPVGDLPTVDVHPPLYFLVLAGWFKLVGVSTWTAKVLSLFASLPTVVLVWALARRTMAGRLGRRAANAATALAALSPVYLWYAQEIRSYTLTVTLGLLAVYGAARWALGGPGPGVSAHGSAGASAAPPVTAVSSAGASAARPVTAAADDSAAAATNASARPGWGWLALSVLASIGLLWTHYLGFFVVAFVAVLVLAGLLTARHWRPLAAMAAVALAAVPLLPLAAWRLGLGAERDQRFVPLWVMLLDIPRGLGVGRTLVQPAATEPGWTTAAPATALWLLTASYAVLLAIGVFALWRTRRRACLVLVGYLLVPVFALYAITTIKPVYLGPQHILMVSPALFVLVGAGLAAVTARSAKIGHIAIVFLVAAMLLADRNFYADDRFAKDDLRGLAAYVDARAVPGDVLAVSDPVLERSFEWLVHRVPVIAIPRMTATGYLDDRPPESRLVPVLQDHPRLWFMTPHEDVATWLDAQTTRVDTQTFHGASIPVRVEAYEREPSTRSGTMPPRATWATDPDLGGLSLKGWEVVPDCLVAGQGARARLIWAVTGRAVPDYKVALRLLDEDGRDLADGDHAPFHGLRPTSAWPRGQLVYEPHDLLVSPGADPGRYRLAVTVYDPVSGAAWPSDGPFEMGEVCVERPAVPSPAQAVPIDHRLTAVGGGYQVLGYDLPDGSWSPGEELPLAVWLRAAEKGDSAGRAAELQVEVIDRWGAAVTETRASLARDTEGEVRVGDVRRVSVPLPAPLEGGNYGLRLRLNTSSGYAHWLRRGPLPVRAAWLGPVTIEAPDRAFAIPPIQHGLDLPVGDRLTLLGYDRPPAGIGAGRQVSVTLYWRAGEPLDTGYHSTVQLVPAGLGAAEAAGPPVAQHDGVPAGGSRPTTGWLPGEVIADSHTLDVPPDLPPGRYLLIAALYDPSDPQVPRPPVVQAGRTQDYVVLETVAIEPRGAAP